MTPASCLRRSAVGAAAGFVALCACATVPAVPDREEVPPVVAQDDAPPPPAFELGVFTPEQSFAARPTAAFWGAQARAYAPVRASRFDDGSGHDRPRRETSLRGFLECTLLLTSKSAETLQPSAWASDAMRVVTPHGTWDVGPGGRFALPLWSLDEDVPLQLEWRFTLRPTARAPERQTRFARATGRFVEGQAVEVDGDFRGRCVAVADDQVRGAAELALRAAQHALEVSEELPRLSRDPAVGDDFVFWTLELAALVGWAHPAVAELVPRVEARMALARRHREEHFVRARLEAGASASSGGLHLRVKSVRCARGQRWNTRPDALEVAVGAVVLFGVGAAAVAAMQREGCGVELDVSNPTHDTVSVADVLSSIDLATPDEVLQLSPWAATLEPLGPGAKGTYSFFRPGDPSAWQHKPMLLVVGPAETCVLRVR